MDFILRHIHPLVFVLLLGSVIPFLLLVRFAHPSADDFCYASLFSRDGFWGHIKGEYLGWKGRYTAIFLTVAYHKAGLMTATYELALALLLLLLFIAVFAFTRAMTEAAATLTTTAFLALGFSALYLGTMPKVPAGLYWVDGAMQYQLGGIFLLLAAAALLFFYRTGALGAAWSAGPLIFLAVGTTELAMISLASLVGVLAFNQAVLHGRRRIPWTVIIVVTVFSAALLILAPGNAVRAEHASPDAGQFWFSFSHAWYHAGGTLASWLAQPGLWLATAAFLPVALRLVYLDGVGNDANRSRFLVILGMVAALLWLSFFGLWWAAATNPPGRALNLIYLVFLCGWFAGVLEIVGIAARHRRLVYTEMCFPAPLRLVSVVVPVLFAGHLLVQGQARNAYGDLLYRAAEYDRAMHGRYESIAREKEAGGEDRRPAMTFPAVANPPRVLMYTDIQADPGNWRNTCFARYFGLKSAARL